MSRWFRFYDDVINDHKVQALPDALFKAWVNILCIASKCDGALPDVAGIAFQLRLTEAKTAELLTKLSRAGLLDKCESGFAPHNWEGRQFRSDRDETAASRSKKYRDGKRSVTRDASVTTHPPEQNRAETEQNRADARAISRETELKVSIVKAFETAGSPSQPDTSRVDLWLSQGFDPAIILAVVSEIVKKKPSLASLNYFDTPIKEAHAVKAEPKNTYAGLSEKMTPEQAVASFAKSHIWSKHAPCGEPGSSTCTIPAELFAKYGLAPDGRKLERLHA